MEARACTRSGNARGIEALGLPGEGRVGSRCAATCSRRLTRSERILPGIIGYDDTVVPGDRERRARRPSHGLPRRARPGQVAHHPRACRRCSTSSYRRSRAARSTTIRFAPICSACRRRACREGRRARNRLDRARAALRREACDARRLDRRSDRRDRSDQSRRGALPGRRGDHPLRPHPAHQSRHLRHQRAARPDREGPGRPVQPDGREGRADQGLPHPPAARHRLRRQRQSRGLHLARPHHHAAQGPLRRPDSHPLSQDARRRNRDHGAGVLAIRRAPRCSSGSRSS